MLLSFLSALALALRLWRLSSCLWFDEVLTLLDFARPPLGAIVTSFPLQNQHMLYSILAHVSIRLFGESAWALRLPAVLFGVGCLWALFLLGRRMLDERQALLACALMTVSYHHIWFSQNARGYTGLLFFATLATWLWLEAQSRDDWPWWIIYAMVVFLGMWVQLMMVFVPAAHILIHFTRFVSAPKAKLQSRWKPAVAWLLAGSLTLQVYALALPELLRTGLHEVSLPSEWTSPWWALAESLRSLSIGLPGAAAALGGAVLLGAGWWGILRRDANAAFAILLPGLLTGVTVLASGHNLWPRFLFFSMGFALLIVVHGAMVVARLVLAPIRATRSNEKLARGAGVALMGLIIAASAMTVPRCYALPKQDFTGARDYVERHRRPGEAVVAIGLAGRAYGNYFAPHWLVAQTKEDLDAVRPSDGQVWLVYTLPVEIQAYHPGLWAVVEKDFQIVKVFPGTLSGGEVTVCRRRL
ncbi:MAG: glycosyltransferase family 39 protein [Acidobacteria bacterium]|nr:glycosyltransferase family 39 protein [Acidobacteriota bacterium]